jgi:nucleoside phosphorylase
VKYSIFRKFISDHLEDYFEDMREARFGGGSGYPNFYRDTEISQHIRDIVHNLEDTFGNVTIPGQFTSPGRLVKTWINFLNWLNSKTEMFEDIVKYSQRKKIELPEPFHYIYKIHFDTIAILELVLSTDDVKKYVAEVSGGSRLQLDTSFDIVILTALYDEFVAFKSLPINFTDYSEPFDSTQYKVAQIGNKSVLFATDDKMGMAAAASLSAKVISKFSPRFLIMGGIAAAVKDKEKNFGDILVCRYTWNYESGKYKYNQKTKSTIFEPNPEQLELDGFFVPIVNGLRVDRQMLDSIKTSFIASPTDKSVSSELNVFMGSIASGSAVVADGKKIDPIKKGNRKLIGIDMETFGVYYAAKTYSNTNVPITISIKSISDFADHRKNDGFRNYAAYTSASFIYNMILHKLQ